jgi:hypothetical protein
MAVNDVKADLGSFSASFASMNTSASKNGCPYPRKEAL